MTDPDTLWQTKLHARLHDPAEKALVLLRDPAGHEGGTSRALHRELGFGGLSVSGVLDPDNAEVLDSVLFKNGIPITMYRHVQRADWWAAGADRPQWPMEQIDITTRGGQARTLAVANWAQVRWTKQPILVHPLTGAQFNLQSLADTDIDDIKKRSFAHFEKLVVKDGEALDWQRTLLAYWRFGPELKEQDDDGKLGLLWPLLPADTRVPDHSIWDHLDLTSAFAGAFAADANVDAALLAVSLGPVQGFISAARSTSDLWAGSHLLSRLAWEAMRVVCERLGPDAVLFPRLRGVPQVDVWLRDEMDLPAAWFKACDWAGRDTDANPLFAAALPNRFVAVVPASQAREIADAVSRRVRDWVDTTAATVIDRLLSAAGLPNAPDLPCHEQMRRQLAGFPDVHWAAVPFSLIRPRDAESQTDLDLGDLHAAMAPFFGVEPGQPCGFLDTDAWRALQADISWAGGPGADHITFFTPKPGTLYPAVFDLAERVLAAAKAARPYAQTTEHGWRDALSGEVEWLTHDRNQLNLPPGQRQHTLWSKVADKQPRWARPGEHLGALAAIKRLWPTLFAEEVARATGSDRPSAMRFVVSTHTMAMAHQIDAWLQRGAPGAQAIGRLIDRHRPPSVALPRKLAREQGRYEDFDLARCLPGLLEQSDESSAEGNDPSEVDLTGVRGAVRDVLSAGLDAKVNLESYYALLLMDGDHMGRILAGDPAHAIAYRDSFHPQVQFGLDKHAAVQPLLRRYGAQQRGASPGRHMAISAALNDFALHVVPEVIEREHLGRLIYAGGDDVLAMLPVADVLSAMRRLRCAYSGHDTQHVEGDWASARRSPRMVCKDGYALLRGQLLRMMGTRATASCGVVIAHHQAPLEAVRRELHAAEQRAKNQGGRDAFSITLIKRSGGTSQFTAKFGTATDAAGGNALDLLIRSRDFLQGAGVSRRAVYNSLDWLKDLPARGHVDMLTALLAYQFARQSSHHATAALPRDLAAAAVAQGDQWREWLQSLLTTAEFLAREARSVSRIGHLGGQVSKKANAT